MQVAGRRNANVAALCAAAFALSTGCYAYQPVIPPLIPANQRVRLHLTSDGTTEMARYLGPRIGAAEGIVASVAPDGAIGLGVQSVSTIDGVPQGWTGEGVVSFPAAYVSRVEQNTLSRRKSVVAAVAIAAGVASIALAALKSGGADGGPGPGGGPNP